MVVTQNIEFMFQNLLGQWLANATKIKNFFVIVWATLFKMSDVFIYLYIFVFICKFR